MKEKTAELKEKIEKDYKDMMAVINSTSLPLFVEDTIEDMHILIKTLIAENKELKEKYSRKLIDFQKEREEYEKDYVPKSKVEETIQTMNTNILNAEKFDCDYIGQCRFAKYVLQSLLGKE